MTTSEKDDLPRKIDEAAERIVPYIIATPLYEQSPDTNVFYKAENLQYTGSFKLRGAASKLTKLASEGVERVITASTGNHGLAVSTIGAHLGMEVELFVPESITETKQDKLQAFPITLNKVPGSSEKSEIKARKVAEERDIPFISPYNDIDIIAGQGTIGRELYHQVELETIDRIYITVGGGGLISGIGSYIKHHYDNIEIVACQPNNSAAMYFAFQKGEVHDIDHQPTISDGSAGGLEKNSITFDLAKQVVDRFVLVGEEEIREAMRMAFYQHNMVIEGAAGVAHAALKNDTVSNENSIVIWCGGNIDADTWLNILSR